MSRGSSTIGSSRDGSEPADSNHHQSPKGQQRPRELPPGVPLVATTESGAMSPGPDRAEEDRGDSNYRHGDDILVERVSPDELIGDKREEYLNKLWELFQTKADTGLMPLEYLEEVSTKMGIEGASADSLNRSLPEGKSLEMGISFEELVELFDVVSRLANEAYRDVDLNKGQVKDHVYVGPMTYLWYNKLCGTPEKGEGDQPLEYRLDKSWSVELTPKRTLLLTTSGLMVAIAVLLMSLISTLWITQRASTEQDRIVDLRNTFDRLAARYESFFFYEHEAELLDQTAIIGDLVDILYNLDIDEHKRRQRRWATTVGGFTEVAVSRSTTMEEMDKLEVLDQLVANGALVSDSALADVFPYVSPMVFDTGTNATGNATSFESGKIGCQMDGEDDTFSVAVPLQSATNNTKVDYCLALGASTRAWWTKHSLDDVVKYVDGLNVLRGLNVTFSILKPPFDPNLPNTTGKDLAGRYLQSGEVPFARDLYSISQDVLSTAARQGCLNNDDDITCEGMLQAAASTPMESTWSFPSIQGIDNVTSITSVNRQSGSTTALGSQEGLVTVVSSSEPLFLMNAQDRVIDAVQYLNWQFVRTTEVVLGRENPKTGVFETQSTSFRFDGCWNYDICFRLGPSTKNAIASYRQKGQSIGITPDYRPEPVDGASQWLPRLQAVLLLERDVQEVRGLGLNSLIEIVDQLNSALSGSTEIELFHLEGQPHMRTFNPYEPCAAGVDCIELPYPIGVYYRYDCAHCQRQEPLPQNASVVFLTKRKKAIAPEAERAPAPIYRNTLWDQSQQNGDYTDYNGDQVSAESAYIYNYSVGIMVKVDRSELLGSTEQNIYVSVAVAVGALCFGLVVQLFLSSRAVGAIENNWIQSKAKIEADRERFGELVGDIIPPNLAEQMMKGATYISEAHNAACVMFADLSNFSEWTKGFTARQTIRLVGYCFVVMDTVAEQCKMRRLTAIGDTYVVYGLHDTNTRKDVLEHPAMRGAKFAVLAAQLFSPRFAHFPERAKYFRDAFKERFRSQLPFSLPNVRFGGHCSTMISCIIDTGRAPRFDCYGMAPSLAVRMVATALPGSTHITSVMKDIVTSCCTKAEAEPRNARVKGYYAKLFTFEEPRKTIVRGLGTITSYLVASTTHEINTSLLSKLGVQRAKTLFDFERSTHGQTMAASLTSRSTGKSSEDEAGAKKSSERKSSDDKK